MLLLLQYMNRSHLATETTKISPVVAGLLR
jgi:hypothetical protein